MTHREVPPPAAAVPAAPAMFHVRMRVLTPLELEKERLGSTDFIPHFRGKDFRLLWGEQSVIEDFSSAPPAVRRVYEAGSSSAISIPRAYYGALSADASMSQVVVDTRSGASVLEIGEYMDTVEIPRLTPALWALDHRAERHHFQPFLRIPLRRLDPPVVPEASREVELWWRLWNLGQIDTFDIHPSQPLSEEAAGGDHSEPEGDSVFARGPGRTFAVANRIARARWDQVRTLLQGAPTRTDTAFLNDLLLHHDRQDPPT